MTTYTNIIDAAPFFKNIPADDQGYLKAAPPGGDVALPARGKRDRQAVAVRAPSTTPRRCSPTRRRRSNMLVTLEDAFIAAYLVGVRDFSTADLRVTAARIMGIESDHRTLARVVGPTWQRDGGPIEKITGIQGTAETVDPPNNNGYERTLLLTNIDQAVEALLPFVEKAAAEKAGFDTSKPYTFKPFTPKLPEPAGRIPLVQGLRRAVARSEPHVRFAGNWGARMRAPQTRRMRRVSGQCMHCPAGRYGDRQLPKDLLPTALVKPRPTPIPIRLCPLTAARSRTRRAVDRSALLPPCSDDSRRLGKSGRCHSWLTPAKYRSPGRLLPDNVPLTRKSPTGAGRCRRPATLFCIAGAEDGRRRLTTVG